jgi:flagellar assembly protein FliH
MMSTVLKKGQQGKLMRRTVAFDMADHLAEAHQIVEAAKLQAAEMLRQSRFAAQQLQRHAREAGHQEGRQAGLQQGRREGHAEALAQATERFNGEQDALVRSLAAVSESFNTQKHDLLLAARSDVLDFAVRLTERVAKGLGQFDRDTAVANVERALRVVGQKTDVNVRANPQDAEALRRFASGLAQEVADAPSITIVEDETLSPGGAVLRAGETEVDARIETQLQQITALLLGRTEDS